MLEFSPKLSHAELPPRLGDDDGGRVFDPHRNRAHHLLDPLAIGALLYACRLLQITGLTEEAVWLLGRERRVNIRPSPSVRPTQASALFESSAFILWRRGACSQQAVIDAGPLGAEGAGTATPTP